MTEQAESLNVFGEKLASCSEAPLTGFYRDGCCNTSNADVGSHTVCVELTEQFLSFTAAQGNDLSTPRPEYGFPGLKAGDRWCVCASRWLEAYQQDAAPRVVLASTHHRATEIVPLELLKLHATDLM
jgi:uncharacterized protein (DUF2237 family)